MCEEISNCKFKFPNGNKRDIMTIYPIFEIAMYV